MVPQGALRPNHGTISRGRLPCDATELRPKCRAGVSVDGLLDARADVPTISDLRYAALRIRAIRRCMDSIVRANTWKYASYVMRWRAAILTLTCRDDSDIVNAWRSCTIRSPLR